MGTITLILTAVIGLLLLAVWGLVLQRSDLRQELDWTRQEAKRWRGEAEKLGWKNPFDACLDDLNDGLARLGQAAETMRRASDQQKRNTEKLRSLAQTAKDLTDKHRRINDSLSKAGDRLSGAAAVLPPAKPDRAAPPEAAAVLPPADPDVLRLRRIDEALRNFQADVAAGRVKLDKDKLN